MSSATQTRESPQEQFLPLSHRRRELLTASALLLPDYCVTLPYLSASTSLQSLSERMVLAGSAMSSPSSLMTCLVKDGRTELCGSSERPSTTEAGHFTLTPLVFEPQVAHFPAAAAGPVVSVA
ncbi:hypothetical protein AOLI_G00177590 [Acnodon oligacanthus]